MTKQSDFLPGGVFFDLDGTLLDTAPDMARALNRLRLENDLPGLPFEDIRPVVSHGSLGLLRLGFGLDQGPVFERLRARFLDLYAEALAVDTVLFEGMAAILDWLEQHRIAWGIVTNKPAALTDPLVDALDLTRRAAAVISGDTLPQRKPDPAPLYHACQLAAVDPGRSIYVGDAERDIEAGRRAGMVTVVARYGYMKSSEQPETWGADQQIDHPDQLLALLQSRQSMT